jgi:hypothetical protein
MIGVILSGGRTRSRHVLSAGTWFAAPMASTSGRELRRFTSGQTELGPPAEEPAVAMPCGRKQQSPVMPGFSFFCAIPSFARRRTADGSTARPTCGVRRDLQRAQSAALPNCARHSDEAGNASPFRRRSVPGRSRRMRWETSAIACSASLISLKFIASTCMLLSRWRARRSAPQYRAATWFDQNGLLAFASVDARAIRDFSVRQKNRRTRNDGPQ